MIMLNDIYEYQAKQKSIDVTGRRRRKDVTQIDLFNSSDIYAFLVIYKESIENNSEFPLSHQSFSWPFSVSELGTDMQLGCRSNQAP